MLYYHILIITFLIIIMQKINLILKKVPWETKVWIKHTLLKGRWHPNNNSTRPAMGWEQSSL